MLVMFFSYVLKQAYTILLQMVLQQLFNVIFAEFQSALLEVYCLIWGFWILV